MWVDMTLSYFISTSFWLMWIVARVITTNYRVNQEKEKEKEELQNDDYYEFGPNENTICYLLEVRFPPYLVWIVIIIIKSLKYCFKIIKKRKEKLKPNLGQYICS